MNLTLKKLSVSILSSLTFVSTLMTPSLSFAQGSDLPVGKYKADYYNGRNFEAFVATREDEKVEFNWGNGSPLTGVNVNSFSARWEGYFFFNEGTYTFSVTSDDGARVYIDDQLLINTWQQQQPREVKATKALDAKAHKIKVEYFEAFDGASVRFSWAQITATGTGGTSASGSAGATVSACVSLTASQIQGVAPFTVRFTAAGVDPKGAITDYEFSLGEQVEGKIKMITQSSNQLIYTYTTPGIYTASVRVKDSAGNFKGGNAACSKKITVVKSLQALTSNTSDELPDTGIGDYIPMIGLAGATIFGLWAIKRFRTI